MQKLNCFKTRTGILFLLSLVATMIGHYACQKEKISTIEQNLPASQIAPENEQEHELTFRDDEPYDDTYFNSILNTAAIGLLELSKNNQFRAIVNSEVTKQFDGDDNVLIMTLAKQAQSQLNIDLASEFQGSINYHSGNFVVTSNNPLQSHYQELSFFNSETEISKSIFSFVDDGDTLFTQIYIPYFSQVNLNTTPVIVPMSYSEYEGIGYRLRGDGFYDVIYVDENYIQNHLVWVVSVNETVGNDGHVDDRSGPCMNGVQDENEAGIDCGGTSGCGPCPPDGPIGTFKHVVLTGIYVSDKKEGSLAGKCDFAMIGFQYNFDDPCDWELIGCLRSPADNSDCTGGNPKFDKKLKELGNSQLNKWYDEQTNPGHWEHADGVAWRSRNFAWNYGLTYPNSCPNNYLNQKSSQLRKFSNGTQGEKIRIVFFERDQSNRRYLYHPNCSPKSIRYKSEQSPYAVLDFDYDDFISQCTFCPGWPSCDPPAFAPFCEWTQTTYNLNGAKIKLTVKEQWQ